MTRTYIENNNNIITRTENKINRAAYSSLVDNDCIPSLLYWVVLCRLWSDYTLIKPTVHFLHVHRPETSMPVRTILLLRVLGGEGVIFITRQKLGMLLEDLGLFRLKPQLLSRNPSTSRNASSILLNPSLHWWTWAANLTLSVPSKPCGSQKPKVSVPFFGMTVPSGIMNFSPSRGFWAIVALGLSLFEPVQILHVTFAEESTF